MNSTTSVKNQQAELIKLGATLAQEALRTKWVVRPYELEFFEYLEGSIFKENFDWVIIDAFCPCMGLKRGSTYPIIPGKNVIYTKHTFGDGLSRQLIITVGPNGPLLSDIKVLSVESKNHYGVADGYSKDIELEMSAAISKLQDIQRRYFSHHRV